MVKKMDLYITSAGALLSEQLMYFVFFLFKGNCFKYEKMVS